MRVASCELEEGLLVVSGWLLEGTGLPVADCRLSVDDSNLILPTSDLLKGLRVASCELLWTRRSEAEISQSKSISKGKAEKGLAQLSKGVRRWAAASRLRLAKAARTCQKRTRRRKLIIRPSVPIIKPNKAAKRKPGSNPPKERILSGVAEPNVAGRFFRTGSLIAFLSKNSGS